MKPRIILVLIVAVLVFGGLLAWAMAERYEYKDSPHFEASEELQDVFEWPISHLRHISIPLIHFGPRDESVIIFSGISKFMILEVIAAGLVFLVYRGLARRIASGEPPRGAWDNFFEGVLTFVRDDIAKPNLGDHDADHYVPFLWTLFLFILFNNLLGMLPFMGSPTASIYVTGGLALCAFIALHGAAIAKMGFGGYVKSLWPHMHIPFVIALFLKPMIFFIELLGTVIKAGVLAVRLFANMYAGHMVLAMILGFIVMSVTASAMIWGLVTGASVLGVVALSLLELFVAFLQAYIFVFLTALFMGMALHPQH